MFGLHTRWRKEEKEFIIYTYDDYKGYTNWFELFFNNEWLSFNYKKYGYDTPYKELHFGFWFFSCFIKLPFFKDKKHPYGEESDCDDVPEYGFTFWNDEKNDAFFADSVHFHWRKKVKIYYLPWMMESTYRVYDTKNGIKYEIIWNTPRKYLSWITNDLEYSNKCVDANGNTHYYDETEIREMMNYDTFEFTHTCQSGDVQHTKAFAYEVKTVLRPKWFKWTKFFEKTIKAAEITFETPIGDHDAWKGPTYSCYIPFRDNESTLEEVVRRVEKEIRTH